MQKYKRLVLTLGIVVVLNLFINYGVATFAPAPTYDDTCGRIASIQRVPAPVLDGKEALQPPQSKFDSIQQSCYEDLRLLQNGYNQDVFMILVSAGVIALLVGLTLKASDVVALGIAWGGLLSIIIGTMRYWSAMDNYLRFIFLGIALAALIWWGFTKMKTREHDEEHN